MYLWAVFGGVAVRSGLPIKAYDVNCFMRSELDLHLSFHTKCSTCCMRHTNLTLVSVEAVAVAPPLGPLPTPPG